MTRTTQRPPCYCRFVKFIFSLGLSALLLWYLALRPSRPTLSVEDFYVPALNTTANQTATNTTLVYHLKLRNNNKNSGVHYDALHLSFYPIQNLTSPVANVSITGFYQGHKKSAHRREGVEAVGVDWERERREVSNGTTTVFRVDLTTAVRYKIVFWNTKRHRITVGGNLTVDGGGALVKRKNKGVKLSRASLLVARCTHVSLLTGLVAILVCF